METAAHPLDSIEIDRAPISLMLIALGIDLEGPDAASVVLGATDVVLAIDLAQTLPEGTDYLAALECMHTFNEEPAFPSVRNAQEVVATAFAEEIAAAAEPQALLASRVQLLRTRLSRNGD
jgi:hypothetical protein